MLRPIEEFDFEDGRFPPLEETFKAAQDMRKDVEERPAPLQGKTEPLAHLSIVDYQDRLDRWLRQLSLEMNAKTGEVEPPTPGQMRVLDRVRDRVLVEFALNKESDEV